MAGCTPTPPRPRAFLLHGFIGVGKTTLARRLEQEHGAIRFTHDEWMSRLHGSDPPAGSFAYNAARVTEVMEAVWSRCLQLGVSVVLDSGFWTRASRDRTRELIAASGGEATLYRLTLPEDEAMRRIARRNDALDMSLVITPATYQALRARFEPLGSDEARIEA